MTVPAHLDERFRDAAAAAGLLDVATATHDSPLGILFLAASPGGLCRLSFDADADEEEERLARRFGARVLRSPRPLDPARRQLDDYFEGRRRRFDVALDLRPGGEFARTVLAELAHVPYGHTTTYGALAVRAGRPRAARAVGTVMNRNPVPIVLPCHRVVGSTGSLVGYGGGLERKQALLRLEGVSLQV
jgi:methylated-DNA-[protein]-cysteine S-methyltransferase